MLVQPLRHLTGPGPGDLHVEACLGRAGRGLLARGRAAPDAVRQRRVETVAERPELERVEQLVDLLPVPGLWAQVQRAGLQRHVPGELGELPVAQHVTDVLAELVPGLALDLVDPVDELGQRAEVGDPLGGGLLPHPGDVGQVVAGVAANRGEVRILRRGEAVLGDDLLRGEAGHLGDATTGHQRGDMRVDQLQHVAVARDDEHVHARVDRLAGQRGDDVVGLVTRHRQVRDAQCVEHLEDQAELAAEIAWGFLAVRLVLDVLLVPERWLAPVERDRHVGRLLVLQHLDEHRGEAVDRVGRLPGGGGEVRGQGEEGPVGEGVPVQQQEPAVRAGLCLSCLVLRCGVLSSRRCHHAGSLVRGDDIGGVPGRPRQEACPERPTVQGIWKMVAPRRAPGTAARRNCTTATWRRTRGVETPGPASARWTGSSAGSASPGSAGSRTCNQRSAGRCGR